MLPGTNRCISASYGAGNGAGGGEALREKAVNLRLGLVRMQQTVPGGDIADAAI